MFVQMNFSAPLSGMPAQQSKVGAAQLFHHQEADPAALQNKKMQLESQMLLVKATTPDGSGDVSGALQKEIETQLEQVSSELRSAKLDSSRTVKTQDVSAMEQPKIAGPVGRRNRDVYEPEVKDLSSPGIYQISKGSESGYRFLFQPYSE